MKNLLLLSLLFLCLSACKKDTIIQTGRSYHVKGDIFNRGAYQPVQPVQVNELYIDPASGLPYAHCTAFIDWDNFALEAGHGVAQSTVDWNNKTLTELNKIGIEYGKPYNMKWDFPQEDLK